MKILVFSDSHGELKFIKRILEKQERADIIFHLGDNVRDAKKVQQMTDIRLKYVKGNCDYEEVPLHLIEEIEGLKILLTHGHTYHVNNGISSLFYAAKENEIDIVLFGHIHEPFKEVHENITFFNPGSIGDKRQQARESYGILEISEKKLIKSEIIEVE